VAAPACCIMRSVHLNRGGEMKVNLVAMAEKPDAEEIVAATVEVDGRR